MNRRFFFQAIAGAPVAAVAYGNPKAETVTATISAKFASGLMCGVCGYHMLNHGYLDTGRFVACANPDCPNHDIPLTEPTVELRRTDNPLVAEVRRREAEEERRRQAINKAFAGAWPQLTDYRRTVKVMDPDGSVRMVLINDPRPS